MNKSERASLAEQLLTNPMFAELFAGIESAAIEAMIHAPNDESRTRGAMRIQEIRALRADCEAALRNNREPKAAPA